MRVIESQLKVCESLYSPLFNLLSVDFSRVYRYIARVQVKPEVELRLVCIWTSVLSGVTYIASSPHMHEMGNEN